jgi:hypothetical protein
MHKTNPKPTPLDLPTRRVWALVTLMISFLFLAAALASAFMKNRIEKSASSEIHVLATTLSAHVEQTLHSADGILASMFAEASKAANTPAEFSAYFQREDVFKSYSNRIADKPFIDVASFIDTDGNVVNFTRSFPVGVAEALALAFELGESPPAFEEVLVGAVQVLQSLLQWVDRSLSEPGGLL